MRIRLHIIPAFCALFALGLFQACGVDPLEGPETGPPTDPSKANYSVCEDPTLLDTDKDGMSDDCEKLLGVDKPNNPDCNSNNIPDGMELLGPNCVPITNQTSCPPAGVNLSCDDYLQEQNGLKNRGFNKVADGAVLANSGLNESAPNGTKIEVTSQFIRIVYNQTISQANSGLQGADILELCGNAPSFIYYRIEGKVSYADGDGAFPTAGQQTTMKLCGPLTMTTATPTSAVTQTKFKWTRGSVKGAKYTGDFDPEVLRSKSVDPDTKLTLTPSQIQNGAHYKMDVKFDSTFKIKGEIYNTDIKIQTPDNITVVRKFKRAKDDSTKTDGSFDSTTTPGMVGPWRAE